VKHEADEAAAVEGAGAAGRVIRVLGQAIADPHLALGFGREGVIDEGRVEGRREVGVAHAGKVSVVQSHS